MAGASGIFKNLGFWAEVTIVCPTFVCMRNLTQAGLLVIGILLKILMQDETLRHLVFYQKCNFDALWTISMQTSLSKVIWEDGRVAALSRTYAVESSLVTLQRPKFAPKEPLPVDQSLNRTTYQPVRPMMPNGIQIRCAVFPQCTGQTDERTDTRPTDGPQESLIVIGRCATTATRPTNKLISSHYGPWI